MKNRKGMSMALTIVVSAVVLIVVSLVIITVVTGGLGKFSSAQDEQLEGTARSTQSASAIAYCKSVARINSSECCNAAYGDVHCDVVLGDTSDCFGATSEDDDTIGCGSY